MEDNNDKWPSWRYGPNGASGVFASEADVPAGWQDHPSKVKGSTSAKTTGTGGTTAAATPPAVDASKGKAGRPPSPLGAARKAYKERFGNAPSPRMALNEINAKLAEAPAEKHDL